MIPNYDDRLEIWHLKPSKRIAFRKLTLNLRIILTITVFALQFATEFIQAAYNESSIFDFIYRLAGTTNPFVVILTGLLIIFFFYLVALLLTNIVAIIWGILNYIVMDTVIDGQNIHIKKGILFRQELEIPIHRLTDIQVEISIIDRILKTADVHCNTAGSGTPLTRGGTKQNNEYVIETLLVEDAYRIRDFLHSRISELDAKLSSIPKSFLSDPRIQKELEEIRELMIEVFSNQ